MAKIGWCKLILDGCINYKQKYWNPWQFKAKKGWKQGSKWKVWRENMQIDENYQE